jgi:hypothetical protein
VYALPEKRFVPRLLLKSHLTDALAKGFRKPVNFPDFADNCEEVLYSYEDSGFPLVSFPELFEKNTGALAKVAGIPAEPIPGETGKYPDELAVLILQYSVSSPSKPFFETIGGLKGAEHNKFRYGDEFSR